MKKVFVVVFALVVAVSGRAEAWSSTGHMITAALAYRKMSLGEKKWVEKVLSAHPDATAWKRDRARDAADTELGLYFIMRASIWPDEIRRSGNRYDHETWHYVDYPLRPDANYPDEPAPSRGEDILDGIEHSMELIGNEDSSAEVRAVYLSWLVHLLGDIHQPLHCASLFNAEFNQRDGDRGGNRFYIRPNSAAVKLHSFWDGLLGTSKRTKTAVQWAIQLDREIPESGLTELRSARTAKAWSKESRKLAIDVAYPPKPWTGADSEEEGVQVNDAFKTMAKETARRRVRLAGSRLEKLVSKFAEAQ